MATIEKELRQLEKEEKKITELEKKERRSVQILIQKIMEIIKSKKNTEYDIPSLIEDLGKCFNLINKYNKEHPNNLYKTNLHEILQELRDFIDTSDSIMNASAKAKEIQVIHLLQNLEIKLRHINI